MKNLILRYLETVYGDVSFKIEEQSHKEYGFGDSGNADTRAFYGSNKIKLFSMQFPARYKYTSGANISVYCRGTLDRMDDETVIVTITEWKRIKVAVKEYNVHFGYFDECILGDPDEPIKDIVPKEMFMVD